MADFPLMISEIIRYAVIIALVLAVTAQALGFIMRDRLGFERLRYINKVSMAVAFTAAIVGTLFIFSRVNQGQKLTRDELERFRIMSDRSAAELSSLARDLRGFVREASRAPLREELLRPYRRLYFFLDELTIAEEYGQYGDKASLVSFQRELEATFKSTAGISIREYLKSQAFEDDRERIIAKYTVQEKPLQLKYEELEEFYLTRNMVEWGLETVEIVTSDADQFSKEIEKLERKFGFTLPAGYARAHREALIAKAAQALAQRLDSSQGSVLLTGLFKVNLADESVELTFTHPATYKFNLQRPIIFTLSLPMREIRPPARPLLQKTGQDINLRVFGELVRDKSVANQYAYRVIPAAVYRGSSLPGGT